MRDIAHFEIALRNAYDYAFQSHWSGPNHWLLDPDSPVVTPIWRIRKDAAGLKRGTDVNYLNRRSVDKAIQKCGGANARPGKVMAELTLGFWSHLTTSSHEKTVWVPYVHHAFTPGTNRATIDRVIGNINVVRNRIAHHEPVFDGAKTPEQEPSRLQTDLVQVLNLLSPETAMHVASGSTVATILGQRP